MNEILSMREKRANLWNAAKAYLDTHRNADGFMSAEDDAIFNKMMDDMDAMAREITRMERLEAVNVEMNKPTSAPLTSAPSAEMKSSTKVTSPRATEEYRNSFWKNIRSKHVGIDVFNALQVGTDSEGGYLVPDEYEKTLIDALRENNIFRQFAHIINTDNGTRKIPVVASHGTASWIGEEAAYPESDDAFSQVTLDAYKLATMIKVSEELLNDSVFDIPTYIASEFGRRIGDAEEEAFFTGNGSSKPTGFLNATGGAQTGVTAAAANKLTVDEVIDLYYSLRAPYRSKAIFIMNDSTVKELRKAKKSDGAYLWQPALTAGTPDTIMNRPVYTSTFMPEIATGNKSVAFGDFSYFWIADRQGRSFKRLNELYATTGQVGFLASQRCDGKLILPEAVKVIVHP
jgi:HK97 family phage major capsid protein